MKAYNIYLIRHGMIKENTQGKYIGHTDVELSEEGRAELEKRIENSVYPWAEAVITSPLKIPCRFSRWAKSSATVLNGSALSASSSTSPML